MSFRSGLYLIKTTVLLFLFSMSFIKENSIGIRSILFIVLFISLLICQCMRSRMLLKEKTYLYSYLATTFLIFSLESVSKYAINNYLHLFYIFEILEAGLSLDRKKALYINVCIAGVSLLKYLHKFDNEFMFHLMILSFIIAALNYAKAQKEATAKIEELSKANERLRIGREIHDSLGHTLTGLIMQLEMAYHVFDTQKEKSRQLLNDSIDSSKKALRQIRQAVENLHTNKYDMVEMIKQFQAQTTVNIVINDHADIHLFKEQYRGLVYRIIQEALTNSVKHGQPENISISVDHEKGYVKVMIEDDGSGAEKVAEGYGLKGMRERLVHFKGNLEYGNINKGFYIKALIPAGDIYE